MINLTCRTKLGLPYLIGWGLQVGRHKDVETIVSR